MRLIKAYIRHIKVEEVYKALKSEGFGAMTLVECEGTGKYTDSEQGHISEKYPFADACKVTKIEILVSQNNVKKVVALIREKGRTGYKGDGMILVSPVDEAYKIKNNDSGIKSI
ncbi:P-II family nitrogen regulator [Marinilabilia sp.]|uniref:P-II family nitrogen regulator n=1 Tax=Marinilabilia sp. TaxID=2021252 RepID=UPI0025C099BF|nr:P-II family nitrogen regulator [Marinilabilia sp.]